MNKKFIKSVLTSVLVISLSITSVYANNDNSMSVDLLDDASKLITLDGKDMKSSRILVGKNLFSMTINNLYSGSLLTTSQSGKSIEDYDVPSGMVGVNNYLNGKARIGICVRDSWGTSFISKGHTELPFGQLVGSFNINIPYQTGYGFVSNLSSSSISGTVSFIAVN